MTAQRWWVRWGARYLAYQDGVIGQVQMVSLAITAFSTFGLLLQNAGYGHLIPYVAVIGIVAENIYAVLYNEGGVRNQVGRDRQDLSNNFADPDKLVGHRIGAVQNAMIASEFSDRDFESILEDMLDLTEQEWVELRDGVDIEGVVDDE